MKIIVEGVNGSGKSTLCKVLAEKYQLEFIHAGMNPGGRNEVLKDCVRQDKFRNCVLDRVTSISEQIYNKDIELSHQIELETYLSVLTFDSIFIYTVGRGKHVLKSYYSQTHLNEIVENHEEMRSRYDIIFKTIPHFRYDFETQQVEEVFRYVNTRNKKLSSFLGTI